MSHPRHPRTDPDVIIFGLIIVVVGFAVIMIGAALGLWPMPFQQLPAPEPLLLQRACSDAGEECHSSQQAQ